MERLHVNQKAPKQAKATKKKPIKVVYISNPMKVSATPADFRAVVQGLTGQDSDITDPSKLPTTTPDEPLAAHSSSPDPPPDPNADRGADRYSAVSPFDEDFTSQMLEDLERMAPPTWYYPGS